MATLAAATMVKKMGNVRDQRKRFASTSTSHHVSQSVGRSVSQPGRQPSAERAAEVMKANQTVELTWQLPVGPSFHQRSVSGLRGSDERPSLRQGSP